MLSEKQREAFLARENPPLRVAILFSSDFMRKAALENCVAALRIASDVMMMEVFSERLSNTEDTGQSIFSRDESGPDLLILAIDESARITRRLKATISWCADGKDFALVGIFGTTIIRPLAAKAFHSLWTTLAEREGYTYFARTVFLPVGAPTSAPFRGGDSILND